MQYVTVCVAFQFTFNKNRPLYIQWYPLEHRIVASWALLHLFLVSLVNTNCDVSVLKWNATLKHWSRQEGTIHNLWHGWACLSSSSSSYTHYALLIASSLSDGQRILRSNSLSNSLQGISIRPFPGLVNYVPAVAHLFCLNLPAAFSQPRTKIFFGLCMSPSSARSHTRPHITQKVTLRPLWYQLYPDRRL